MLRACLRVSYGDVKGVLNSIPRCINLEFPALYPVNVCILCEYFLEFLSKLHFGNAVNRPYSEAYHYGIFECCKSGGYYQNCSTLIIWSETFVVISVIRVVRN